MPTTLGFIPQWTHSKNRDQQGTNALSSGRWSVCIHRRAGLISTGTQASAGAHAQNESLGHLLSSITNWPSDCPDLNPDARTTSRLRSWWPSPERHRPASVGREQAAGRNSMPPPSSECHMPVTFCEFSLLLFFNDFQVIRPLSFHSLCSRSMSNF